ncbi:MAG: hypothetical protein Q9M92_04900 [Enterobacterales bacterium]|nr:hypothetical protein [Enterobacterales bacterium]
MKNSLRASIAFYYQGEEIQASLEINLDKIMQTGGVFPELYPQLANSIKLDSYSYQYEMMLSEPIKYDHASGLALQYLENNQFDFIAFKQAWNEDKMKHQIEAVCQQYLEAFETEQLAAIKPALAAAYRLGLDANKD